MQTLRQHVPKEYTVENVGELQGGGVKVRISGMHELHMQEVNLWQSRLRDAGWAETVLFDMDDESLTFLLRKQKSFFWTYVLLLLLTLTLSLRLLGIV